MLKPKAMNAPATSFAKTAAPAQQWDGLLGRICADTALLARFLNTLSLMEHIGSRKIMASQSRADMPSGRTLKHLAEEARHAFFLKRAAEGLAGRALGYGDDEIIAGAQARFYMGRLDAFIARSAQGPAAYLYMSLVVELRAIWFYETFQGALKQSGQALRLTSLLAEEKRHLADMRADLKGLGEEPDRHLPGFVAYEEKLFGKLTGALAAAI